MRIFLLLVLYLYFSYPTYKAAWHLELWVVVQCGEERLVRNSLWFHPLQQSFGARVVDHVLHEGAGHRHVHGTWGDEIYSHL